MLQQTNETDDALIDRLQRSAFRLFHASHQSGKRAGGGHLDQDEPLQYRCGRFRAVELSGRCRTRLDQPRRRCTARADCAQFLCRKPAGRRTWRHRSSRLLLSLPIWRPATAPRNSELSTIDTGLFLIGVLTAAAYFKGSSQDEKNIRAQAQFPLSSVAIGIGH